MNYMKHFSKRTAPFLCAAILLSTLSACGAEGSQNNHESSGAAQIPTSGISSSSGQTTAPPTVPNLTDATVITLSGSSVSVEGKGAAAEGGSAIITAAGTYMISGSLEDGRIIVNAPGEEVTLTLNGANITCSYGSPLYIYKAGTATVYLMEGTENTLTDGASYTFDDAYSSAADDEPNACLYSKADLVIEGTGSLTVTSNYNNGITSKDTLQIYDSIISVKATGNGINGKDSNTIADASITVACGGDAIRSTNDKDEALGWISISNSTLALNAGEDGIQAETSLTIAGGSYTVTSGGGSGIQPSDDASAKGIKAGTDLTLIDGSFTLDCSDDAIHANKDVTVAGGSYTISTGDDAIHADETLTVSAGEINVLTSYEGLEGSTVEISGGTIHIVSSDDGVNAAGGVDGSGFGGFGHGNTFGNPNSNFHINISGGYLVVKAGGDGLDSNGSVEMTDGTVIVFSTGQGDGALDYDGSFTLSGGTLLAADAGGMSQTPSTASQYTVFVGFNGTLSPGTCVSLAGEDESFVFELPVGANNVLFSSPDLKGGGIYTVSYGGVYSGGDVVDGICSGGAYSGGTALTELTLSDYITTYGSRGMGNMGGRPNGNMGGFPKGDLGEPPTEGFSPESRPDSEMPGNGGRTEERWNHSGQDGRTEEKNAGQDEPPSRGSLPDA